MEHRDLASPAGALVPMGPMKTPKKNSGLPLAAGTAGDRKAKQKEKRKQQLDAKNNVLAAVAPAGHSYSDSLLGNAEAAAVVTRPMAKAKASSAELAVSKAIRDNFSELTAAELDLVLVEGLSLRDTLLRDKRLQRGGQLTMGKFYYESIRKKFLQTEDGQDNLKVKDTTQEVPEQLMAAMRLCLGKLKKVQPLQDWLEVTRGVGHNMIKTTRIMVSHAL